VYEEKLIINQSFIISSRKYHVCKATYHFIAQVFFTCATEERMKEQNE